MTIGRMRFESYALIPHMRREYTITHRWWHRFVKTPHRFYVRITETRRTGNDPAQPFVNDQSLLDWLDENCQGKIIVSMFYWQAFREPRATILRFSQETDAVLAKLYLNEYMVD